MPAATGKQAKPRLLHGKPSPYVGEGTADAGLEVSPSNLQRALLDGEDSPGDDGDVLTSRGPGLAPLWKAGGGGGGSGGPIDPADLPITSRTQLGALIIGPGLSATATGLTTMDIASLPALP
jgi:hypothetical protein